MPVDLTFNFEEFTQECRCLPVALQPGTGLESLYDDCEALLELHHPERVSLLDCKAGCGSCCIVNVSVLLPEALSIIEYLEAQSWHVSKDFLANLDRIWPRICGVDAEERLSMRQSCVFLDETGSCSIYPVRPLLCRGVTSTSSESCKQALNINCFEAKSSVEMNLFQRDLFDAAYIGLSEGLEEQGVDGRGFELTGLVRYLLRNPQRRADLQSGLRLNWSELI